MNTEIVKDTASTSLDKPGLVTTHADGSFSVDGLLYLPEVKCYIIIITTNLNLMFDVMSKRKDFDINNFEFKANQESINNISISMFDMGEAGNRAIRYVARQHLVKRHDEYYLKVEVINIVYANKKITCKCMSSSNQSGSLPDRVLIQSSLDQFYCVGVANSDFSIEDLKSAIDLMNKVRYGGGMGYWFHDVDFNLVRSFNKRVNQVIGTLRPIEAIQIASQLNQGGNWDKVQRFDMSKQIESK